MWFESSKEEIYCRRKGPANLSSIQFGGQRMQISLSLWSLSCLSYKELWKTTSTVWTQITTLKLIFEFSRSCIFIFNSWWRDSHNNLSPFAVIFTANPNSDIWNVIHIITASRRIIFNSFRQLVIHTKNSQESFWLISHMTRTCVSHTQEDIISIVLHTVDNHVSLMQRDIITTIFHIAENRVSLTQRICIHRI